jgi:hypothetical protein
MVKLVNLSKNSCRGQQLLPYGLKLLQLSPSSAAIEPVFSKVGVVQTKLHNQLGLEKAARLVMCYRQLQRRGYGGAPPNKFLLAPQSKQTVSFGKKCILLSKSTKYKCHKISGARQN